MMNIFVELFKKKEVSNLSKYSQTSLTFLTGGKKNQHLTGCGVFSDPKRQWVLHMTKP